MAASSLFLRTLRMASTERVLYSPGSALSPAFLPHFSLRGHHLACRSFSTQALQVSEPESRISKKGRNPSSSWEEAGELFFSSKNGKTVKGDDGGEEKITSVRENVQNRSSRRQVEEEPADKGRSSSTLSKFERNKGRSTDAFDESNGQRGYGRGREGSMASDGGFSRRQFSDVDNGRGAYRGNARNDADARGSYRSSGRSSGFREEFSNVENDRGAYRGNARNDADARGSYRSSGRSSGFRDEGDGRMTYRSNARSGGFREEFSNGVAGRGTYRSKDNDGGFRKPFSDSNDRSRGVFHNKNQGGTYGKKQFPDLDGGKRLFNGRFQGNGFVRKQTRDVEDADGEGDNSRKGSYGASKRGQSGNRLGKQIQDEEEAQSSSEDDDDESEDVPEAGDVVRYNDMANAKPRRQSHGVVNDGRGELEEEEDEEEDDEDEDEDAYRRKSFGVGRRDLPAMGSSLPRIKGEVVYGVGPVYAALQISRREIFCLYVQANMPISGGNASKKKDKKALEWIIRSAVDRGLEVKEISKHDLNMLADNRPHQGLILDASPLQLVVSSELDAPFEENGKAPVWVALDEVTDPQNFGAILRSSYFLGAAGVVVCAKNSAPLSAVVSKASAGALEVMELRSCKNMMKFLDKSMENGWRVVGGSSAAGAEVTPVRELTRGLPTILVLGGEGKGLRTNVKRSCSELVCIPGLASESPAKQGSMVNSSRRGKDAVDVDEDGDKARNFLKGARDDFIAVESLNVSVAAGILLHELLNSQSAAETSTPLEMVASDEPLEAAVSDECLTVVVSDAQENPLQETDFA